MRGMKEMRGMKGMNGIRGMISAAAVTWMLLILCACTWGSEEWKGTPENEKAAEAYREFVLTGEHEKLPPGFPEKWDVVWMESGKSLLFLTNNAEHDRWQGIQVYTFDQVSGRVRFLGEYGSRGRLWVSPEKGVIRARYGLRGGYDVILRLEKGALCPVGMFAENAAHEKSVFYEAAAVPPGYGGSTPEEEDFDFEQLGNRISEEAYHARIARCMGENPMEVDYDTMKSREAFLSGEPTAGKESR